MERKLQIFDKVRVPKGDGSYIATVIEFDGNGLVRVGCTNIFNEYSETWINKSLLHEL